MWFEPIFLSGSLAVFKITAKPLKLGGFSSPPQAAKKNPLILRLARKRARRVL